MLIPPKHSKEGHCLLPILHHSLITRVIDTDGEDRTAKRVSTKYVHPGLLKKTSYPTLTFTIYGEGQDQGFLRKFKKWENKGTKILNHFPPR